MITLRKNQERGRAELGWLHAQYSFSFARYHDPNHMGFSSLRVINEDRVEPGQGFPNHGHDHMEIITYVISGALQHKDSLGNGSIIIPGEVQLMSAGTGIQHSEFNHSSTQLLHLLQIWIEPAQRNTQPSYAQKDFSHSKEALTLVVSPTGDKGSLVIKQDAYIYRGLFNQNHMQEFSLKPTHVIWIQMIRGTLCVDGMHIDAGDGIGIRDQSEALNLESSPGCEFLLFMLPCPQ